MKAVVKYGRGKGLVEIREVPEPTPKDDEVLIEVKAISVCGSDLHIYNDRHPYWPPVTLGHEFSGVIVEIGKEVKGLEGRRPDRQRRHAPVPAASVIPVRAGFLRPANRRGPMASGRNGAFTKYVAGPARLLHALPDHVPFETAAVMEPTAICVSALLERGQLRAGESVVISGPGPIGLLSLAVAKTAGARMVGITGRSSAEGVRFEKAGELGADFIINIDKEDPVKRVLEMTNGQGVDLLVETSGGEKAISQAFEMVRRLGRVCAVGVSGIPQVSIPYDRGIFKGLRYDFCFSSSWTSWETALGLVGKGRLPVEKLITHRLPLEKWEEAFKLLESRQCSQSDFDPLGIGLKSK